MKPIEPVNEPEGTDYMPRVDLADQTDTEAAVSMPKRPHVRRLSPVAITSLVLTVLLIALGAIWWHHTTGREETDNAYVEGHISYVSPRISGTVTKVLVEEHEPVKKGQLLVILDARDQQVKLDESKALLEQTEKQAVAAQRKIQQTALSALGETSQANGELAAVRADIAGARSAVMEANDQMNQAKSRLKELVAQEEYARVDFERYQTAYSNRAVMKQQYDKANQSLQVAIAQREQGEQNLSQCKQRKAQAEARVQEAIARLEKSKGMLTSAQALVAQKAVDESQYSSNLASVKHQREAVNGASLQLSYTQIYAPVEGRIGKKSVEVGQRVEPGQTLLSVVQDKIWIMANYKETQIGKMRVGQQVEIKVETFPERTFKGTVDSIGPASGAKFSMLPPDNATGNFTKIVQRIPVKIVFDEQSLADYRERVTPGMSCLVTVLLRK
jgi:membrane fusion protein, multidrug efflux system